MNRVGQNRIYTVHITFIWLDITKYTVYVRIYTVLANPSYEQPKKSRSHDSYEQPSELPKS